jgi:hypothetical protein
VNEESTPAPIEPIPDALREVIAASPVRELPASYWWVRVDAPSPSAAHLAVVTDGVETTVVTSDRETVERGPYDETEGPFACFRLEISVPFGGPGFIAAATSACAARGLNVCVISTFSFDYLFVPLPDRDAGIAALRDAGFPIAD